jgi:hypothetical protein
MFTVLLFREFTFGGHQKSSQKYTLLQMHSKIGYGNATVRSLRTVELRMSPSTLYNIGIVAVERQQWLIFCIIVDQHRCPRLCVVAYGYFIFLGRVTSPSAKPPFLEDQFVSEASLLRPARLGRPYQEHEVPAGIARKVIEARKVEYKT